MSDLDKAAPKEIDRKDVRDELEFRWSETAGHSGGEYPDVEWVLDQLVALDILRFREPPVDPSLGEIRRVAPSLDGEPKTAVKVGGSLSLMPSERFLWVVVETGEMLADGNIDVLEVVGAVSGTPAWERQQVELEHTDCFEPEPVTGAEIDAWARAETCTASEGATGIACVLARYHPLSVDHKGTHVPNESVPYPLFVRWPWQQHERDYSGAAGVLAEDAPPLPVADPDVYPHYYQSDDDSGQWWRIDALDGPVMWRRHERANWVESSIRAEEALVAMLGGRVHRFFGEVTS